SSPIDSHVVPVGGPLPGYDTPVIMAAGTFVFGASSELSADSPLSEPYTVYVQGGLSYAHVKLGIRNALSKILLEWGEVQ
ncbi:MAG: methionine gamma-lyase family protein, partial [bacterium]|nr:methionine gamma-lyase family protein [bacterium]